MTSSKRLWAPWRVGYIVKTKKPSDRRCLFCSLRKTSSDDRFRILRRGAHGFSVLNRFPYNNGHLLIAPYRHVGRLESLKEQEWVELFRLATDAIARLDRTFAPQGYNMGINLGRAAGAGMPGHLHLHIVPRWTGDTNFMPTLADTKVISQSLDAAYAVLKKARPSADPS